MAMIDEFREHEIYKKFKSMYPNSTESYALYESPGLEVEQSDNHNNTLSLMISKGDDVRPYYYSVICSTDRWLKPQGVPFEAAFDFLDDNDCLQPPAYNEHGLDFGRGFGDDRWAPYCNNSGHLLVLRASLKFACVYPETAIKMSWHPAVFDDNGNVTVSDSVIVRTREQDHRISYTVIEGLLNDMRYHPDWNTLWLEIRSQSRGGMELSVPKQLFEQGDFFMVLENNDEVVFTSLQDEHNYLLQFNFTRPDPVIEVFRASIP